MKKFERLPPEQRKAEICQAALRLFAAKGFAATTMENIVSEVSLSKGGVYRFYASTSAILGDLILEGMRFRNAYYAQRVQSATAAGEKLTLPFLVEVIGDSLTLSPEISRIYVEFLWEKQRDPGLEALYQDLCQTSIRETTELVRQCGAGDLLGPDTLARLTELMNAAVLSLHVLHLEDNFTKYRPQLVDAITRLLTCE